MPGSSYALPPPPTHLGVVFVHVLSEGSHENHDGLSHNVSLHRISNSLVTDDINSFIISA